MNYQLIGAISETSPASASTVVSTGTISGLASFEEIHIEAILTQATGGVLDVYLQRKLANNLWSDYAHFTQLAAGSTVFKYSARSASAGGITVVGGGTDATPGVVLAANTILSGHPGTVLRAVFVAGVSTSAGATQTIRAFGLTR
jgi:hypothetical protein